MLLGSAQKPPVCSRLGLCAIQAYAEVLAIHKIGLVAHLGLKHMCSSWALQTPSLANTQTARGTGTGAVARAVPFNQHTFIGLPFSRRSSLVVTTNGLRDVRMLRTGS